MSQTSDKVAELMAAIRGFGALMLMAGEGGEIEATERPTLTQAGRRIEEIESALTAALTAQAPAARSLPEGWRHIRVNGTFDELLAVLERADRKGYMPDAMADEWGAFEYQEDEQAAPQPIPSADDAATHAQAEPEMALHPREDGWIQPVCRYICDVLAEGTASEKAVARTVMHLLPLQELVAGQTKEQQFGRNCSGPSRER